MSRLYLAAVFLLSVAAGVVYGHGGSLGGGLGVPGAPSIVAFIETSRGDDPTCVAPCEVVAWSKGTTLSGQDHLANPYVFKGLDYHWDYGEGVMGNWPDGPTRDRGVEIASPMGAHVYETPGVYTMTLTVQDPITSDVDTATQTITVTAAAATWDGDTVCYSTDGTGTCPDASAVQTQTDFDAAMVDAATRCGGGPCSRILFKSGQQFTTNGQQTVPGTGPVYLGRYESGALPIVGPSTNTGENSVIISSAPDNIRIVEIDWRGRANGYCDASPFAACTLDSECAPDDCKNASDFLQNMPKNALLLRNEFHHLKTMRDGPAARTQFFMEQENVLHSTNGTGIVECTDPCLSARVGNRYLGVASWSDENHFLRVMSTRGFFAGHNYFTTPAPGESVATMRGPRCGCCDFACSSGSATEYCRVDADCGSNNCVQPGASHTCEDLAESDFAYFGIFVANHVVVSGGGQSISMHPTSNTYNELLLFYLIGDNLIDIQTGGPSNAIVMTAGQSVIRNNTLRTVDGDGRIVLNTGNGFNPVGRTAQIADNWIYGNSVVQTGTATAQTLINGGGVTGLECRNNVLYKDGGSFSGDGVNNCATESNTVCYSPSGCTATTSPYTTAIPDPAVPADWVPHPTNGAALIDAGDGFAVAPNRRDATGAVRIVPDIGAVEAP